MTKAFVKAVESMGWTVTKGDDHEYELGKYSPAGQDFSIVVRGETTAELIDEVYDAYDQYDPSWAAVQWTDESGHGVNGAPYELKDIIADMEACKENLLSLHEQLEEYDFGEEEEEQEEKEKEEA